MHSGNGFYDYISQICAIFIPFLLFSNAIHCIKFIYVIFLAPQMQKVCEILKKKFKRRFALKIFGSLKILCHSIMKTTFSYRFSHAKHDSAVGFVFYRTQHKISNFREMSKNAL